MCLYIYCIAGNLGCGADALSVLDASCSGQPSCLYPLPNQGLAKIGCSHALASLYLEASYECYEGI